MADIDTLRLIKDLSGYFPELNLFVVLALPTGESISDKMVMLSEVLGSMLVSDRLVSIRLETMEKDDVGKYIRYMVKVESVPDEFLNSLFDKTGGNPFFVKEIVSNMVASGDITIGDELRAGRPSG